MIALLWILEAVLLGCLLLYRWTNLPAIKPGWAGRLLVFGAGAAAGLGLTSCLFFLVGVLLKLPWVALGIELSALAWTGLEVFRKRVAAAGTGRMGWLPAALVLTIGIATAAMAPSWVSNPHGRWDAWSIWNMRARFLAATPDLAPRAWGAELGASTHREYPLLVSGFVARVWRFSGTQSTIAPAAASYVFFLALLALTAGGVAALRGGTLGWLAALVLATTPAIVHEVPAQYADIPLACYLAASVLFALLERPMLAGLFAGLAAWTKDEGLLFLVVFLIAVVVARRRTALLAVAGAAPAGILTVIFKFVLVEHDTSLAGASLPGAAPRLADLGRYATVFGAFVREFLAMAETLYHPILPLLVLVIVLPFERERRRDVAFALAILLGVLAGYFGIYLITPNDLDWQLQSSLGRLFVHVWPLAVVATVIGLRPPEEMRVAIVAPQPEQAVAVARKRRKR